MELCGRVSRAADLTEESISTMYSLMRKYYDDISWEAFIDDLSEKDWVILMEDSKGIRGFSTQMLLEHTINEKDVLVVYSGDTIIDRAYWGSFVLPVTWVRMMRTIKTQNNRRQLYWFLISKGYRTYRFLPTFFRTYFPSTKDCCCEFEKRLLQELAIEKFGSRFNPETYIIQAALNSQKLKTGICDISHERRENKHIAFFEEANPGHAHGDELACIARFEESNLTPFILKRTEEQINLGAWK